MSSSQKIITIALDVMGGDNGPSVDAWPVPKYPANAILKSDISCTAKKLRCYPNWIKFPRLKEESVFVPCEISITMDDKPSQALRHGRRVSGMWKALDSVRSGDADVMISAGNTGALMAMARFCLRMMPGIERPALAAIWPNVQGESIVLDVGATIGADAEALVDYALMGSAMSRALFDLKRPRVGLLNIGVEEVKGLEEIRTAGARLKEINLPGMDYRGFVEGDDLGQGAELMSLSPKDSPAISRLKSAEGTAKQVGTYLRDAMSRTLDGAYWLFPCKTGVCPVARQDGPSKGQWRGVFGSQRRCDQKPRWYRCAGFRQCN